MLICFAGSALAQTLPLPPRATNAPSAGEFAQKIAALDLAVREREITTQIFAGNVPDFLRQLRPVTVTNVADGITNTGTFFVTPDYLAIGPDADYLLMPISGHAAQRIADKLDCVLPTRKMVDAIYAAAEVKLTPTPIPPTAAMTTVPIFTNHNETVRAQRAAFLDAHPLGALVAGHKKDVVITARLNAVTNKIAIYGWHRLTNGVAIQPLYLGHVSWWVDYSQCIRLVSQTMLVNGKKRPVAEVLADPKLCGLISDEGAVTNARYPTNPVSPAFSEKINLPWPQKFSTSTNFEEMTREIRLPDDVRILVNAPELKSFSPDRPVLLVFFALPNGNTIEQTLGKALQPGDDWHFDIQHIGAQTRWLRNIITNRTIVVAYLEAGNESWPAWRKTHADHRIAEIIDGVREIFPANKVEVVLASHSGGGSLMFGYLNAVDKIPDEVKRIAFLDSDYAYDSWRHAEKIARWLATTDEHRLCVLAYQDYLALLNGKTFVSEAGGTWGRSHVMLGDLRAQLQFISQTNDGLEIVSTTDKQIEFLLKENPEKKILHTVQVERNGFIQALLSGTADEGKGYEYLGARAYTNWIR
ncbi:MAG: hypothetical protein P4N60_15450 [Verrucomicrobiae bacterium]|nr:hypothetical protein [Verrucomicrobiae bacterium]